MKKKKILAAITIAILIIIPVFIYASFLSTTKSNNVITFGKLKMELIETSIDKNGNERNVSNNENEYITINSSVSRRVRVKNICNHPMFIRIKLDMLLNDKNDENIDNRVTYDINEEDFIYRDGWYYYKEVLKPGEETNNLITKIDFNLDNYDETKGKSMKLNIDAQAVQSENQEEDVLLAKGWPAS